MASLHHQVKEIETFKPNIAFQEGDISYARHPLCTLQAPHHARGPCLNAAGASDMSLNPLKLSRQML